jgi:peptidoglycan hydrolase-like protein with peptidoglycan-binding domain
MEKGCLGMSGRLRDLAAVEPWSASLQRSRARRARSRKSGAFRRAQEDALASLLSLSSQRAGEPIERDLAAAQLWELSLGRSRARRRAAELRFVPATSRAKRLSLGAIAAFSVGPTASLADGQAAGVAAAAEPPTTTEQAISISEGSEGKQVELLQRALGRVHVDGIFGPETEAAVRAFQASRGLAVDGLVGPATSAALRASLSPEALATGVPSEIAFAASTTAAPAAAASSASAATPTAPSTGEAAAAGEAAPTGEAEAAGEAVPTGEAETASEAAPAGEATEEAESGAIARLQAALHLSADGIFGPETEAAVRRLQARNGLSVDGIVGPATWSVIGVHGAEALTPPESAVEESEPAPAKHAPDAHAAKHSAAGEGSPEGAIARLQSALNLSADGTFGPETLAAVRRLQARHGLSVDGVVGPATWSILDVHSAPTLTPPRDAIASHSESGSSHTGESTGEGVVARVIAAADEIATRPYVFGGGHGSFQSSGYDCSGSVSYALHGGGLLSSPEDSSALESYGEAGPGRNITIYANAEHAFMVVDGRRFDTIALQETGTRWSGSMSSTGGYVVRHPAGL